MFVSMPAGAWGRWRGGVLRMTAGRGCVCYYFLTDSLVGADAGVGRFVTSDCWKRGGVSPALSVGM